nr:MAG TPA: hypothetical protein [Caudoviricetes sp.]
MQNNIENLCYVLTYISDSWVTINRKRPYGQYGLL